MNDFEIRRCLDNIRNEAITREDTALKLLVGAVEAYLERSGVEDLWTELQREGVRVR